MSDEAYYGLIARATRSNREAAEFLETICRILHFWDDLADGDRALDRKAVDEAMWRALVLLPRNRFYRLNFDELNPILALAIQNWRAANMMEETRIKDDLHIAFVIRSSYVDLVTHVALLCGGPEWGLEIALSARRMWHCEGFDGYLRALDKEQQAAEALGGQHVLLR